MHATLFRARSTATQGANHIHSRQVLFEIAFHLSFHLDDHCLSPVVVSFKILLVHSLTFSQLSLLSNSKSRASVNTLSLPAISAATGTAMLLTVIHFHLSTALITIPYPLTPSSFFASFPAPSYRFPLLSNLDPFSIFVLPPPFPDSPDDPPPDCVL